MKIRLFEEPNINNDWKCPICKTNDIKPVILIGIEGTQEGNNMQSEHFHVDCIDLLYYKKENLLFHKFPKRIKKWIK